eukprot:6492234-Prymnesium_polylepis.1
MVVARRGLRCTAHRTVGTEFSIADQSHRHHCHRVLFQRSCMVASRALFPCAVAPRRCSTPSRERGAMAMAARAVRGTTVAREARKVVEAAEAAEAAVVVREA